MLYTYKQHRNNGNSLCKSLYDLLFDFSCFCDYFLMVLNGDIHDLDVLDRRYGDVFGENELYDDIGDDVDIYIGHW